MHRLTILILLFLLCLSVSAQEDLPRNPTVDEVASFLRFHLDEPPVGFISYFWVDEEPLHYADLNGDGEDDLIAHGWLFVAVMLREGDGYGEPFQVIYTDSPESGAWSHIELDDWTLNGIPDITFDRRVPINGVGYTGYRFLRTIISCELICYVAWEGEIAEYIEVESEQGIYLSKGEMTVTENDNGRVVLDVITEDFAFNCSHPVCGVSGDFIEQDRFQADSRIGATVRSRYLWDGLEFLQSDTLTLIGSHMLPAYSQLSASNPQGQFAQITYDEQCQFWLDDRATGETFSCVVDFVRVDWHENYWVLEYATFTEEIIVLYDTEGNEQLRVSGAIRDRGLFGVRLDEQVILSAGERYTDACPQDQCWFSLNQDTTIMPLE